MITVEKLNFDYPGKRILQDVSFTLQAGSITALVGPNGAGKTTLLRCLAGLEKAYSGTLTVDGIHVVEDPRKIHRTCGYLSDFFGLYDSLTIQQCLTYAAWCHKIAPTEIADRIAKVALQTGLSDMLDKNAGVLSRGYRQRLGIALALMHDPKILILDEPASGMDPEARIGLSTMMRALQAQGKTIIVSSHILNELEDYCTDMLVIRDGRVSDHVSLKEYSARALRTLRIGTTDAAEKHLATIAKMAGVTDARIQDGLILCSFDGDDAGQGRLLQDILVAKIPVFSISDETHKLQDVYMSLAANKEKG